MPTIGNVCIQTQCSVKETHLVSIRRFSVRSRSIVMSAKRLSISLVATSTFRHTILWSYSLWSFDRPLSILWSIVVDRGRSWSIQNAKHCKLYCRHFLRQMSDLCRSKLELPMSLWLRKSYPRKQDVLEPQCSGTRPFAFRRPPWYRYFHYMNDGLQLYYVCSVIFFTIFCLHQQLAGAAWKIRSFAAIQRFSRFSFSVSIFMKVFSNQTLKQKPPGVSQFQLERSHRTSSEFSERRFQMLANICICQILPSVNFWNFR